MTDFLLPDVGEGLVEAEIVTWHVKVGDTVAVNDPLVDIETAKSVVELPSPFAGVVSAIHVDEGATVRVGTPIVTIGEAAEIDLTNPGATGGQEGESLVGRAKEVAVRRRRRRPAMSLPATPSDRREPIRSVRKEMGAAMVRSAFSTPHVTTWLEVDVSGGRQELARLREVPAFADARPTFLFLAARACALAVERTPLVNSSWDDKAGEVVFHADVNLGIATATDRGLIVPVIASAQRLSATELAGAVRAAVDRAREGRTSPSEMSSGTFTITDIGSLGVDGGTPIIYPGQSAILCLGSVHRRPWVVGSGDDERLAIRDVCLLGLTFDHRHIDGATGAQFLTDVARFLAAPTV